MKTPPIIANFDSATAMLRALARYLHGQDFPGLGVVPGPVANLLAPVAPIVNALPTCAREFTYAWSGWGETIPPDKLAHVRVEEVYRWMVSEYPRRQYPAAMIGSSNGAAVHLCAALGIPWLPQTFLMPVRQSGVHPDEPRRDLEAAREPAQALLTANPDIQLHHMHDANQDRLMIQHMTYFRIKRLRLGEAYRRFLRETLPAGATLFLLECRYSWPTTQVAERHIFQHGAAGGATAEEYFYGSKRVEDYLRRYHSPWRRWDSPEPDGERPEAEWGFAPALREDVERLAREQGYRIRRIVFQDPEHLSPLVADLYRWWYMQRGIPANRLLIESFILLEPWWALRTGSVPFWTKFPVEPSAAQVEQYLDRTDPYDAIAIMLFSHGVDSIGLAPIQRWRAILKRAQQHGSFIGVDARKFPRDFATFVRYHTEIQQQIHARYPLSAPLALSQLDTFLEQAGDRYPAQWLEDPAARRKFV
jgi:hypothetical protein